MTDDLLVGDDPVIDDPITVSEVEAEVTKNQAEIDLESYQTLLKEAHDSHEGMNISDLPLNHPYWSKMEIARRFAHEKGFK